MDSSLTPGNAGDTICAVSTPPGRGGLAIIRVSGPKAISAAQALWKGKALTEAPTHTAHLGRLIAPDGEPIDQAVATLFKAPASFTGEDVVELSVHGSTYIQATLVKALCAVGCRLAEPGEFTRRAFENGRLDLAQAEAVADIIATSSATANRLAQSQLDGRFSARINALHDSLLQLASLLELELDFSEEDVTFADRTRLRALAADIRDTVASLARTFEAGDNLRRGIPVAIIGEPNSGKSSLLNTLLGHDRAIVSDIPGTTRDTIEETTLIGPYTFRFIDTAGLRHTDDPIENLGIGRALDNIGQARIIIWLIPADETSDQTGQIRQLIHTKARHDTTILTLRSKADLAPALPTDTGTISIKQPETIERLRHRLLDTADSLMPETADGADIIITNERHRQHLQAAGQALDRLITGIDTDLYTDLIAQELRQALHHLSSITGAITTDTILTSIFTTFCIGK